MAHVEMDDSTITWQYAEFAELAAETLYQILRLRQEVFILEQSCLYMDLDGRDQQALHLGAWRDGVLMGYLRALPPGADYPESSLGRIVVSPRARGLNLGRNLVKRGIALNLDTWPGSGICIGAQAYLEKFYVELGFETISDVYDEDGIPHIKMRYRETP